jgi:hypothetical protein
MESLRGLLMLFSNIIRFGILSCLGVVLVESSWAAKPDSKKPSAGQTADKKTVPVTFKPIQQVGKISAKDLASKIDAEFRFRVCPKGVPGSDWKNSLG